MVDKIVYSYHFTSLANIDDLRAECKAWLITILDKFDPAKGSKAFSYFSVVTKNWFIHKVKKQTKRCQREIEYDLVAKEVYEQEVQAESNYLSKREKKTFGENCGKRWMHGVRMICEITRRKSMRL